MFRNSESSFAQPNQSSATPAFVPPIQPAASQPADFKPRGDANSRNMSPFFMALGVLFSWLCLWQPLAESRHTGHVHYFFYGILLGPVFLYLAIVSFFTDISDQEIRRCDARGRKKLTAKGRKMVFGSFVVMFLTNVAWFVLLNILGFEI